MKIFVIGSNRSTSANVQLYKRIADSIEDLGHKVDRSWLNSTTELDSLHFEKAHKRDLTSIKNCEVMVVEATDMMSGVGFLIATALNEKKPVLALIDKKHKGTPSITLRGSSTLNKFLKYETYSMDNLKEILNKYFVYSKGGLDTKFILIISPDIDRYLQWASENRRMHKAQVVRLALEDVMEKDKEYTKHLKETE